MFSNVAITVRRILRVGNVGVFCGMAVAIFIFLGWETQLPDVSVSVDDGYTAAPTAHVIFDCDERFTFRQTHKNKRVSWARWKIFMIEFNDWMPINV